MSYEHGMIWSVFSFRTHAPEPGFKQLFAPSRLDGELRFKQEYGNAFSSNTFYLVGDIVDRQEMYGSMLNGY